MENVVGCWFLCKFTPFLLGNKRHLIVQVSEYLKKLIAADGGETGVKSCYGIQNYPRADMWVLNGFIL